MYNINELYEKIKENNIESIELSKKMGININTEFQDSYSNAAIVAMALLYHPTRECFDEFYNELKNAPNTYQLENFLNNCFNMGVAVNSDGTNNETKRITLDKALFTTLKSWNIDVFNELKEDALNLIKKGSITSFNEQVLNNCEIDVSMFLEGRFNFIGSSYNDNALETLNFLKKLYHNNPFKEEQIFHDEKYKTCVVDKLLDQSNSASEFLKIVDWLDEKFGLRDAIINRPNLFFHKNEILNAVIDEIDINRKYENGISVWIAENELNISSFKEFFEMYINPDVNNVLLKNEEEFFWPEDKNRVVEAKKRAAMFQKRLLCDGLADNLHESQPENKKRL